MHIDTYLKHLNADSREAKGNRKKRMISVSALKRRRLQRKKTQRRPGQNRRDLFKYQRQKTRRNLQTGRNGE